MREIDGLDRLADRHVYLSLSGGKDSTAMAAALKAAGVNFTAVFLDTGWETAWTYDYIRGPLTERFGPIVERCAEITLSEELEPVAQQFEERLGHYSAMVRLILKKGMFPSRLRRWCTQVLKVFTMRDYLVEVEAAKGGAVNAVGIRKEEGFRTRRSKTSRWWEPVWSHTQTFGVDTWHPILLWTEDDVIEAHHEIGLEPNPHYLRGSDRVGCLPCIHARKSEISAFARYHPERVEILADLERVVGDLAEERAHAQGTTLKARGHHRPTFFQSKKDDRKWVDCPECARDVLDDDDCYALGPDDGEVCPRCNGRGKIRTKGTRGEMWGIHRVVAWSMTDRKGEPFVPEPGDEGCMKWGMCASLEPRNESVAQTPTTGHHGPGQTPGANMDHVTHVRSNVKVGADVELGKRTLIIGRNGIGKSTITNSIELALTGRVSDMAGKQSIAKVGDLTGLLDAPDGILWSEVDLNGAGTVRYEMRVKGPGSGSRPDVTGPDYSNDARVHPVRMLEDAFASADKAKRFLLEHATAAGLSHADVLARIPKDLQTTYERVAKGLSRDPVSNLLHVIETARKRARDAKREAKHTESAVEETTGTMAAPATQAEMQQADAKAAQAIAKVAHLRTLQAEWDRAQERLDMLESLEAAVAPLRLVDPVKHRRASALVDLLGTAEQRGLDACPLCTSMVNAEVWGKRRAGIEPLVEKYRPPENYAKLPELEAQIKLLKAQQATPSEDRPTDKDVEIAETARDSAVAYRDVLRQREAAHQALQATRTTGREKLKVAAQWAELETAAVEAMELLVRASVDQFCELVNQLLPDGDDFRIRLGEGKSDVVRYGLLNDTGTLRWALSGAEWARVTAAMAAVISRGAPLAVIMPEERAFDPKTLRDVMDALSGTDIQVILCTPVKYKGRKPAGWTIVDLDKAEKAATKKAKKSEKQSEKQAPESELKVDEGDAEAMAQIADAIENIEVDGTDYELPAVAGEGPSEQPVDEITL